VTTAQGSPRRLALAHAGLVFAVAAPALYMLHRAYEHVRVGSSDPTLVLEALHTAFFWRAAIAVWAAGALAAFAFMSMRRAPERSPGAARRLALLAMVVVPLVAAGAWVLP